MKPFWEDEYLNKEKSTFGNPSKEVKEFVPYLKKDAKIHKLILLLLLSFVCQAG